MSLFSKRGFTLIEVIVVIGSVAIILPALFNIVFSLLHQQIKLYKLTEVKRQGDYALTFMENTIRNSAQDISSDQSGLVKVCDTPVFVPTPVAYFRDSTDTWFRFVLNSGKIASDSGASGSTDITSSRVSVSGLSITCTRTATYSPPIIQIQYTVSTGSASLRAEEKASMIYKTRVKMRSY